MYNAYLGILTCISASCQGPAFALYLYSAMIRTLMNAIIYNNTVRYYIYLNHDNRVIPPKINLNLRETPAMQMLNIATSDAR